MTDMAMTLRLTDEDQARLAALAEREGTSLHEAALRSIRERYDREDHRASFRAALVRTLEEDAELLDRLGRA
jgi:predicted transcriptional regulator